VSGAKIKPMAEASSGMLMATSTRASGKMTKLMVLEFTSMSTVPNMKATGKTISKTDREWRAGKTAADTKEDIKKA